MGKLKKVFIIVLFLFVTLGCIALGIRTRYNDRIKLELIKDVAGEISGYIFKTREDKLVVIDGGNNLNTANVVSKINSLGGKVEYWFVTNFTPNRFGVLNDVLTNNSLDVNNIVVSLNSDEWYELKAGDEFSSISTFLEILRKEEIMPKVQNVTLRQEIKLDNLKFKILKIAENDSVMCFKVDNMFKSIMFLSDLKNNVESEFINNNQDEIKSTGVQSYNKDLSNIILESVIPEVVLGAENTVEIW